MRVPAVSAVRVAAAALLACAAAAAGASFAARRADAQEQSGYPGTVYVSGLRIDGKKSRVIVRFTNTSPNLADTYKVHYTVEAPDGNPLTLLGAGIDGAPLVGRRSLELDLGAIVADYRRSVGVGPYAGPVRLVVSGEPGAYTMFGPETVHVAVVQTEGAARFEPLVEWR